MQSYTDYYEKTINQRAKLEFIKEKVRAVSIKQNFKL